MIETSPLRDTHRRALARLQLLIGAYTWHKQPRAG